MRLMRSGFFLLLIGTCTWTAVYGKPALTFEQNQGHADARVKFLLRDHGHTLFLTSTKAVLSTDHGIFRMKLSGANPISKAVGSDLQATISNYFIGNDPARWRTDVPNYGRHQSRRSCGSAGSGRADLLDPDCSKGNDQQPSGDCLRRGAGARLRRSVPGGDSGPGLAGGWGLSGGSEHRRSSITLWRDAFREAVGRN